MTLADMTILFTCGVVLAVESSWKTLMHRRAALLDQAAARFDAAHQETVRLVGDLEQALVAAQRARVLGVVEGAETLIADIKRIADGE